MQASSRSNIGIAGAGLLGRLAAWTLAHAGHQVSVFDPAPGPEPRFDGQGAAGLTAAGMLSPLAERETADADVAARGWHSIDRWRQITERLHPASAGAAPLFAQHGSLLVAHGSDQGAARRVLARLGDHDQASAAHGAGPGRTHCPHALDAAALSALEPALHSTLGPLHAWMLAGEAHIDTVRTLHRLHEDAPGVQWHWNQPVQSIGPGRLDEQGFDWTFDLRGVGAKAACAVRGVRGEVVWLHAPGLSLTRPVRLLHPRLRSYGVPRGGAPLLGGPRALAPESRPPDSLPTSVELMAAAHSVLPALAESRILRLDVNLRPALPDHRPQCHVEPGLVRINGLYRHGWLLGPSLMDEALAQTGLLT